MMFCYRLNTFAPQEVHFTKVLNSLYAQHREFQDLLCIDKLDAAIVVLTSVPMILNTARSEKH
jgi:hypothetical protein